MREMGGFLLAAFLSTLAESSGQTSLGEIANRERERRTRVEASGVEVRAFTGSGEVVTEENGGGTGEVALRQAPESRLARDEMREQADALEPQMASVSDRVDALDRDYRRYMDACYGTYTQRMATSTAIGVAPVSPGDPSVGRSTFSLWDDASLLGWNELWTVDTALSNETRPECRMLWSDIVAGAESVERELETIRDDARRQGMLPGVVRDLERKYRLDLVGGQR